ncbi:MAG: hypothetical protein C0P61_003210 [Bacillota bacterium]|nr:hypothetical protein [Bacillota bacterium]REJ35955.1 MAG: hypothetical protein DIU82_06225 [Bacillota bacterium]
MGVNFPDLQVLLPRVTELGRLPPAGHQVDAQQQALAMAAQVQAERDRQRVLRSTDASRGTGARRAGTAERRARAETEDRPADSGKLGRHLDVRG